MDTSRRQFLLHAGVALPLFAGLNSCGGGGGGGGGGSGANAGTVGVSSSVPATGLTDYGKNLMPYSVLAKPSKLVPFLDPDFKTKMVRLTDASTDWHSQVAVPAYPTTQAWNCDESLLILYVTSPLTANGISGSWALMDGNHYNFIQFLPINPADVEQFYWSTTEPSAIYYLNNAQINGVQVNQLVKVAVTPTAHNAAGAITQVSVGSPQVLHDFANDFKSGGALYNAVRGVGTITEVSGGEDPFAMSETNDLIGLGAYLNRNGPSGGKEYASFSYRISTNTIGATKTVEGAVPQATPSGSNTYFYNSTTSVSVMDPVSNAVKLTLPFDGTQHSDMLRNSVGDDVVAGVQFDVPSGGQTGTLVWTNLSKGGSINVVIGPSKGDPYPPGGTLVSGRAYKVPGWVAVGITGCPSGSTGDCQGPQPTVSGSPRTYLDQEILISNIDSGAVYRVAHHRTTGNYGNATNSNYWAQPNVTISPSGTRILFASDWGSANPSAPVINGNAVVDTYVVELPGYGGPV